MNIFFKIFFLMWNILKVFIEFITTLLLFYVFFLAIWHVGSELPDQGSNPVFEGGVLTTGLLGKAPL